MFKIFKKTYDSLGKTRKKISNAFSSISNKSYLDSDDIELLEDTLIESDLSLSMVDEILFELQKKDDSDKDWKSRAKSAIEDKISNIESILLKKNILLVGINGSGKTTTAAKLAKLFKNNKEDVLLVAADTYRAAAVEQIRKWAQDFKLDLICNENTLDPASVAYDGVQSGISKNKDRVIIDTAGRLHTSVNLMNELKKIYSVVSKLSSDLSVLMVVDANIGKNAISQIRDFNEFLNIDALVITKLDGTAKGGVALSAIKELKIPVQYIGMGENIEDIENFDLNTYLDGLLGI